jgi:hypothetical protein
MLLFVRRGIPQCFSKELRYFPHLISEMALSEETEVESRRIIVAEGPEERFPSTV